MTELGGVEHPRSSQNRAWASRPPGHPIIRVWVGIARVARNDNFEGVARSTLRDLRDQPFFQKVAGDLLGQCRFTSTLTLHSVQQHRHLFDNLDVESFECWHFSGMVSQQTYSPQIQVGKNLRSDTDLALGLAFALW
jgi:hypothetical protein